MDWPHDPDGEEGSEGGRKYGHAVIAKKIDEEEDFPLDVASFVAAYGDDPVRIGSETVVSVQEIFESVEGDEFEDFTALHRALGEAMRRNDHWFYEGPETFVGDA
jgi:hypothetical protein